MTLSRANQDANESGDQSGFGSILKSHRMQRGLTLEVLAKRAGCTKGYLSQVERSLKPPPGEGLIDQLEQALSIPRGSLARMAQWEQTPEPVRRDLARLDSGRQKISDLLKALKDQGIDDTHAAGELARIVDRMSPELFREEAAQPTDEDSEPTAAPRTGLRRVLPTEVPLINSVTAGYPADFSDMGYPARVADEYIRSPDLNDPDAFAARVVGDSMEPEYREGDVVIFSPAAEIVSGNDCFVRFEPDHESTFKRIYFEKAADGTELIRIQPINNRYPPQTVPREQVAGLYRASQIMRPIG